MATTPKKDTGVRSGSRNGALGKPIPQAGASDPVPHGAQSPRPPVAKPDRASPVSQSTASQQPTMLESEGGTAQPHPTMAPRPGRSGNGSVPTGRAHDGGLRVGAKVADGTIKVRATTTGYYNHVRRREGDVFIVTPTFGEISHYVREDPDDPTSDFKINPRTGNEVIAKENRIITAEEQLGSWMERVDEDERESFTTAKDAVKKAHDEILGDRSRSATRGSDAGVIDE